MKKVTDIFINKENLPVFHTEDGKCFKAHQNPTGNCWMLTFEEVNIESVAELDVFEIDGVSVHNSLFVGEKILMKNGFVEQTAHEAMEALRPLFIRLDQHKEMIRRVCSQGNKEVNDNGIRGHTFKANNLRCSTCGASNEEVYSGKQCEPKI